MIDIYGHPSRICRAVCLIDREELCHIPHRYAVTEGAITVKIYQHFHKQNRQLLEIDVPKRLWNMFLSVARSYTAPAHIRLAREREHDVHYQVQCPASYVGSFILDVMRLAHQDLETEFEEPPVPQHELSEANIAEICKIIEESEQ